MEWWPSSVVPAIAPILPRKGIMTQKMWVAMTPNEKANRLRELLDDFINHQNGSSAKMNARLLALEETLARMNTAANAETDGQTAWGVDQVR